MNTFIFTILFASMFSTYLPETTSEVKEPNSTRELLTLWKGQYSADALNAFTFVQTTIRFKENKPVDTSTWYEAIQFPDRFRIDFGEEKKGNSNVYRNDSIYVYREGELVHQDKEIQQFLLIEGGIYFNEIDVIMKKLNEVGIDTSQFRIANYKGRKTFVIGAAKADKKSPQIWLDAEYRATTYRVMKFKEDQLMEVYYDRYKNIDGYWTETWLEFFIDGNLIQTEEYHDIQMNAPLNEDIFKPESCLQSFWY